MVRATGSFRQRNLIRILDLDDRSNVAGRASRGKPRAKVAVSLLRDQKVAEPCEDIQHVRSLCGLPAETVRQRFPLRCPLLYRETWSVKLGRIFAETRAWTDPGNCLCSLHMCPSFGNMVGCLASSCHVRHGEGMNLNYSKHTAYRTKKTDKNCSEDNFLLDKEINALYFISLLGMHN
jgi:hypothetical protein